MDPKALVALAIHASLFLLVLAFGLRATPADALYLVRRPRLLLRSIVAIDVVVPAFAAVLVAVAPLAHPVDVGIVLMAVSPLPPLVPGKQLSVGCDVARACGLLVAMSLLSIVSVPLTLAIINDVFSRDAFLPRAAVAMMVGMNVVLPVGLGMTLHGMSPRSALRAAPVVFATANLLLLVAVVPVLLNVWPLLWELVGNGSVVAIMLVVAVALAGGHWLGGPDPEDRTLLAFASAMRHPGIALAIARASGAEPRVTAAVLLFVIVGALTMLPYNAWRKRQLAGERNGSTTSVPSQPALGRTR